MVDIDFYTVLAAAIASFLFGALWYSPLLFMKRWLSESGTPKQALSSSSLRVYLLTFSSTLVTAFALALVMGPAPSVELAIKLSLLISITFVAASVGINYQFAQRCLSLWLIDSGFHVGRFLVMALIICYWPA